MENLLLRLGSRANNDLDLNLLFNALDSWNSGNYMIMKEQEISFESEMNLDEIERTSFVSTFKFSNDLIYYLASVKDEKGSSIFSESFLNYLQRFYFSMDFDWNLLAVKNNIFEYTFSMKGKYIDCCIVLFFLNNFWGTFSTEIR
jgi:hypothetical protein